MLKLQYHLCIYSRTKWFNYENPFFLSPLSFYCLNMFPITFTQTFESIAPTSILELAITTTFEHFYPPPILTKHPIWYPIDTNFFIALRDIPYGLHWQHF